MRKKILLGAVLFICSFCFVILLINHGKQKKAVTDSLGEEGLCEEEDRKSDKDVIASVESKNEQKTPVEKKPSINLSNKEELNLPDNQLKSDKDPDEKATFSPKDNFSNDIENKAPIDNEKINSVVDDVSQEDSQKPEDNTATDDVNIPQENTSQDNPQEPFGNKNQNDNSSSEEPETPTDNEFNSDDNQPPAQEDIQPEEINPTMEEYYIEECHLKTGTHEARVDLSNGNTCFWIGEKHCVLTPDQCVVLEEKMEENRVKMNNLKYVAKNPKMPGVFLVVTDTYPIEVPEEEFYENPEYNEYLVFESEAEAREYKATSRKEVYENTILSFSK